MMKRIVFLVFLFFYFLFCPKTAWAACPTGDIACSTGALTSCGSGLSPITSGSCNYGWTSPAGLIDGNYGSSELVYTIYIFNSANLGSYFSGQWVQIDLGSNKNISQIKVLSGGIWNGQWYGNATFQAHLGVTNAWGVFTGGIVQSSGIINATPPGPYGGNNADGTWYTFNFNPLTPARYVGIASTNFLPIWREIEVYSCIPNCTGKCGGTDGCTGTCPNNCVLPQTCGAITPNVCGCIPTTCGSVTCGTMSDGCGGTLTCGLQVCPNNAGIVQSGAAINSNFKGISKGGADPGFRLTNYTSGVNVNSVSYNNLLTTVLKNAGLGSTPPGNQIINGYKFISYSLLESAFGALDSNYINVLIPLPGATSAITSPKSIGINVRVIVFINGSLDIGTGANIQTSTGTSSIIFISNGDLTVNSTVTRLDGIYIFPGVFSDGSSANQLTGYGSLLNTGTLPLGFQRYYTGGPAEQWFYQPKYLNIYKNVLAVPKYSWTELLPS